VGPYITPLTFVIHKFLWKVFKSNFCRIQTTFVTFDFFFFFLLSFLNMPVVRVGMKVRRKRVPFRNYAKGRALAVSRYRSRYGAGAVGRSGAAVVSRAADRIFPLVKSVPFTYSDDIDLSVPTGSLGFYKFKANDCYDPDESGTGHQPRFFDTLMGVNNGSAPYQDFVVHAAKCVITARNPSASHMFVALSCVSFPTGGPATLHEARERADTVLKLLSPVSSSGSVGSISMYRRMAPLLGVKDVQDDEDAKGTYGSSPVAHVHFVVTGFNPDSGTTVTLPVVVQLTQYAKISQKNDPADS